MGLFDVFRDKSKPDQVELLAFNVAYGYYYLTENHRSSFPEKEAREMMAGTIGVFGYLMSGAMHGGDIERLYDYAKSERVIYFPLRLGDKENKVFLLFAMNLACHVLSLESNASIEALQQAIIKNQKGIELWMQKAQSDTRQNGFYNPELNNNIEAILMSMVDDED